MTNRRNETLATRASMAALAGATLAAFLLRVWHISSGVPFSVGFDEPFLVSAAMRIVHSGDFNPHVFDYPGLYIYAQAGLAVVVYMLGAMSGAWSNLSHFGNADLYLWGRLMTVGLGTATVYLVYRAGLAWGLRTAVVGALLMAVAPLHVRESHFVLTDVPMTFFVTLTLVLSLRALEEPSIRRFVWAGVAAGLAAGSKYNGLFALVMPLVAAAGARSLAPPSRTITATLAACGVAFLVVSPYTVLDLPGFLNGWGNLASAYRPRSSSMEAGWLLYMKHIRGSFGWPGTFMAVAGFVALAVHAVRGRQYARPLLLILFPLAYFWLISRGTLAYGRYALPLVPFVCVWAAVAFAHVHDVVLRRTKGGWRQRSVIVGLITVMTLPPIWSSIDFLQLMGVKTTQAMAWDWISRNVMLRTRVVSEARSLELPPERYAVESVVNLADVDPARLGPGAFGIVIMSSEAWRAGPELAPQGGIPASHRALFERARSVNTFLPKRNRPGPKIYVLVMDN